jgi:hypothetical protein
VFVFDFFRDSECDAEWRVVAHAAASRWDGSPLGLAPDTAAGAAERRDECARHCAPLDPLAHGRLLLELQLLYVALSRGRRRAFIFDRDTDKRAPMYAFLGSPVSDPSKPGGVATAPVAVFDDMADVADDDVGSDEEGEEHGGGAEGEGERAIGGGGGGILSASRSSDWQTTGAAMLANGLHEQAARAFFAGGNQDGGWRATGGALALAADAAAAAGQEAKRRALHLQAAHAYARGHAHGDALASLRAAGETALAAAAAAAMQR